MDNTLPTPWSEERFQNISLAIINLLVHQLHFLETNIQIIPVSGLKGTNLTNTCKVAVKDANTMNSELFQWYKGLTLIDCINNIIPSRMNTTTTSNTTTSSSSSNSKNNINTKSSDSTLMSKNATITTHTFRAVITDIDLNLDHNTHSKSFTVSTVILRGSIHNNRHIGVVGKCICQIKKIMNNRNNSVIETATVGDHVTLTLTERYVFARYLCVHN